MNPTRLPLPKHRNSSKATPLSWKATHYLPLFVGSDLPYTFKRSLTERGPNF